MAAKHLVRTFGVSIARTHTCSYVFGDAALLFVVSILRCKRKGSFYTAALGAANAKETIVTAEIRISFMFGFAVVE